MLTLKVSQAEIKPFLTKDGFRPAMQHVLLDIENGCFVATNGHILIKHKLNVEHAPEHTPLKIVVPVEAFPKKKGGETVLTFEVKELTQDAKGDNYAIIESISIREYDSKGNFIENRIIQPIPETFPNYQVVIPNPLPTKIENSEKWDALYDQKAVQCIGFDWDLFKDVSAFLANRNVKLSFHGQSTAMMITSNADGVSEWEVLVMPSTLGR